MAFNSQDRVLDPAKYTYEEWSRLVGEITMEVYGALIAKSRYKDTRRAMYDIQPFVLEWEQCRLRAHPKYIDPRA